MAPRTFPYHPFLIALIPSLVVFVNNVGQVAGVDVLPALGLSLLLAGLSLLLGRLLTRDLRRGGLVASLALLLFYSHGHIQAALTDSHIGSPLLWLNRNLLPLWALVTIGAAVALARTRRRFESLTRILTLTSGLVVALQVGQVSLYKARAAASHRTIPRSALNAVTPPRPAPGAARPDVYYIILDRYPNEHCLRETYGFDNSPFLDFLRSRGFYVASESHSNYCDTAHSLSSSLNLEYLDALGPPARLLPTDWMPLFQRISDHRLGRWFRGMGYRFIHFGSCWPATMRNPLADRSVNVVGLEDFDRIVWEHSAALPLLRALGISDPFREKQRRVSGNVRALAELAPDPAPTFAFAHFLVPHPPFVFDATGPYARADAWRGHEEDELMLAQLRYANLRLTGLVDSLLTQSSEPPIIILQGDEGPYPKVRSGPAAFTAMSNPELRVKTSILNAIYLPGPGREKLYPTISPVNTFRLIFNEYFGADLEALPDRIYAFPGFRRLYDFVDVTERAREPVDQSPDVPLTR